jgi:hypothetical protein
VTDSFWAIGLEARDHLAELNADLIILKAADATGLAF